MHHVRGNHDAMLDPTMALEGAPFTVELGGVTLAVLDTVRPATTAGRSPPTSCGWLDDLAAAIDRPGARVRPPPPLGPRLARATQRRYFGINPDDSEAFVAVVARRENIVGYFAGHTHRNRIRRFGPAPATSVRARSACTKDYPGVWAEYRVYEGGYTQVVRRIPTPAAFAWTERTRPCSPASTATTPSAPSTTAASPTTSSNPRLSGFRYSVAKTQPVADEGVSGRRGGRWRRRRWRGTRRGRPGR